MEEESRSSIRRTRRGSLVVPLILIGLGIVFLLNNLGYLEWSVWDVAFTLWPVLLIAAGLDIIIGRRSVWGTVVSVMLTLVLIAGALWLVSSGLIEQDIVIEEISQAVEDVSQADVTLSQAVGTLRVDPFLESTTLIEGLVRVSSTERLHQHFSTSGDTARFTLRSEGWTYTPITGTPGDERDWELILNSNIPMDLDASVAVGRADLNLTELTLDDLDVSLAVGEIDVDLPRTGDFRADVEAAVGNIVVTIPENMSARIQLDTALVSRQLPDGYAKHGDVYTSPGYEGAENRVDLAIDLAIGNVTIRH